ncbi:hypothetical protein ACS0TY_018716 [Phlomoides rotata]
MDSKNQSAARPLANFHPDVWGDRFLVYEPESNEVGEKQVAEELKEEVKRELKEASIDYVRQLKMVDAIQRLGIEYLFQEEIDEALQNLSEKFDDFCKDKHDLYTTALSFRLLRQHGYRVSCKTFDKFKDEEGGFKFNAASVTGVLEFFEATYLRVHDDELLDRAHVFTRNYLESVLPSLSNPEAEQVGHALYQYSNRRGFTRLEARHYIPIYEKTASHNPLLLKLAKLDFKLLQSMHKRELSEICRWWKSLEVPTKLFYARDRIVENYFWVAGIYFEPEHAFARNVFNKLQMLVVVCDDTFDAYATFEELQLFTEAIESWSASSLDHLPDNMKLIYKSFLEIFDEFEEEMIKQGRSYRTSYGIEAIKMVVRYYFDEIKWRGKKKMPTMEEYMEFAKRSTVYLPLMIVTFMGMGDIVTKQVLDWVLSEPPIVTANLIICRLTADIVGHEFERDREHIPSSIECYMKEHKASEQDAIEEFNKRIESAWKDINETFFRPTEIPAPLLVLLLNYARVMEVIYSKGDWFTHVGPEMKNFITQLYIHPLP